MGESRSGVGTLGQAWQTVRTDRRMVLLTLGLYVVNAGIELLAAWRGSIEAGSPGDGAVSAAQSTSLAQASLLPPVSIGPVELALIVGVGAAATAVALVVEMMVLHLALARLRGEPGSLSAAWAATRRRSRPLAKWGVVLIVVGLILVYVGATALDWAFGAGAVAALGTALVLGAALFVIGLVVLYVVPTIAIQGSDPVEAVLTSARTLRSRLVQSILVVIVAGLFTGIVSVGIRLPVLASSGVSTSLATEATIMAIVALPTAAISATLMVALFHIYLRVHHPETLDQQPRPT